jgi:hypothetical protein
MKTLRMFFAWPLIFAATWYFFSFQVGVIVSLAYLHVVTILLIWLSVVKREKLPPSNFF